MAQIWRDDENTGVHMLPRSARKAMGDSAKKSVLGKLDNVLNNKAYITPFKGASTKWPASCAPKISLCRETLQKQHLRLQNKERAPQPDVGLDLFDCMDFPTKKCLQNCHKPISENCLEPLLSDDLIAKLLNYFKDTDEEIPYEMPPYPNIDADDFELKPMAYKKQIHTSEDNLSDIFEVKLPTIIFDTEFVL